MSQHTENQFGTEVQGTPSESRGSQSDVIAHLRESTQKIDALERQIAQLYTLLNDKYKTNNNTNDEPLPIGIDINPYPQHDIEHEQTYSPSQEDGPNNANFLHMRRKKKKRHRKRLLDLRGRVSLTPSLRSPGTTTAPSSPAPNTMQSTFQNSLNVQRNQNQANNNLDSVNSYPNLLRSNLNMRVINLTAPSQSVHNTNKQLYESDSRIFSSMSENPQEPPSPLYIRRSFASSSSDSTVQGEDSDTNSPPQVRSVRVSAKPTEDNTINNNNNNSNTTSEFNVSNNPSYEIVTEGATKKETVSQVTNSRDILRKASTSLVLPPVVSQNTADNDVEMEYVPPYHLPVETSITQLTPSEEPKDINTQVQEKPSAAPVEPPPSAPPVPVERKGSLKSSKIRDVFRLGMQRAKSFYKNDKAEPLPTSPPPPGIEHVQTEQELESELESLLFSSAEGLWETKDIDGAPKLFNISIILENYDDIFSDFDPRPFAVRTVSDDFLDECRRRLARVPNKGLKELGQLALLVPGRKRDTAAEQIIIRRLQQHFNRGYSIQKGQNWILWRRGFIWVIMGMLVVALNFAMEIFLTKEDEGTPAYWTLSLLTLWLDPAGTFFFWEGLEHLFFYVRENSSELEFYRDMSKISFQFHTIDAGLQSKLKLAYANYTNK